MIGGLGRCFEWDKIAYDERRQYTVGDNLTGVIGYPTKSL